MIMTKSSVLTGRPRISYPRMQMDASLNTGACRLTVGKNKNITQPISGFMHARIKKTAQSLTVLTSILRQKGGTTCQSTSKPIPETEEMR